MPKGPQGQKREDDVIGNVIPVSRSVASMLTDWHYGQLDFVLDAERYFRTRHYWKGTPA